jgi:hypothetical protein
MIQTTIQLQEQLKAQHLGKLQEQVANMRQARLQNNLEGMTHAMTCAQEEQQLRIQTMEQIKAKLQAMLNTL